jgi:hypothetical protein
MGYLVGIPFEVSKMNPRTWLTCRGCYFKKIQHIRKRFVNAILINCLKAAIFFADKSRSECVITDHTVHRRHDRVQRVLDLSTRAPWPIGMTLMLQYKVAVAI